MDDVQQIAEPYNEGEAGDAADEVVDLRARRPLDKVIPVRFTTDKWDEIRAEAVELGIGPSTLARMWILEKLRARRRARAQERATG